LQSNVEKTTLLKIGATGVLSPEILELGFNVTDDIILLGMTINRNLTSLENHFEEVIVKISRLIEFWDRFKLTLCGRISICKTFMISQIGYLGSILNPTDNQAKRLQKLLDDFCTGKTRVAKKKLYLPPSCGGVGLIKLTDYLTSLQCSWIKRVTQHWGDNWRYDVKVKCYGNPLIANASTFNVYSNPILHNVCSSFERFVKAFTAKGANYKKALIFKNPLIRRGRNDNGLLCENFFGRNKPFDTFVKIAKLKFEDFFVRNGPKSLHQINVELGLDFSLAEYLRIHEALGVFSENKPDNDILPQSLEFFLKSFEKGSKPFRRILMNADIDKVKMRNVNTVKTFFTLTDIQIPEEKVLKFLWADWNCGFYTNRCREFLYKFRNNILGINARVCKFVNTVDAECTLCCINKEPLPVIAESFVHLFFYCPAADRYRTGIENKYFPEIANAAEDIRKNFWFIGKTPGNAEFNPFVSALVNVVNHAIWELKLKKDLVPVSTFLEDFSYAAYKLSGNKFLRESRDKSNLLVCRHEFRPP
jgi:hypothetical protein